MGKVQKLRTNYSRNLHSHTLPSCLYIQTSKQPIKYYKLDRTGSLILTWQSLYTICASFERPLWTSWVVIISWKKVRTPWSLYGRSKPSQEMRNFSWLKWAAALSPLSDAKSPGAGAAKEKVVKFGVSANFTTFSWTPLAHHSPRPDPPQIFTKEWAYSFSATTDPMQQAESDECEPFVRNWLDFWPCLDPPANYRRLGLGNYEQWPGSDFRTRSPLRLGM